MFGFVLLTRQTSVWQRQTCRNEVSITNEVQQFVDRRLKDVQSSTSLLLLQEKKGLFHCLHLQWIERQAVTQIFKEVCKMWVQELTSNSPLSIYSVKEACNCCNQSRFLKLFLDKRLFQLYGTLSHGSS